VAIPFDTLDYARKLESAGVPAAQAEIQATVLGEAFAKAVATPADLLALEGRLTGRIDALEARIDRLDAKIDRLDAKIENVKVELSARIDRLAATVDTLKWMFGFIAALNIGVLVRLLMIR
jgi:septal ring factor EnvC (AmiA/AmiB activator)